MSASAAAAPHRRPAAAAEPFESGGADAHHRQRAVQEDLTDDRADCDDLIRLGEEDRRGRRA